MRWIFFSPRFYVGSNDFSLSPHLGIFVYHCICCCSAKNEQVLHGKYSVWNAISQFVVMSLANETYFQWKIKYQLVEFHELSSFNLHKVQMAGERGKKRIQEILKWYWKFCVCGQFVEETFASWCCDTMDNYGSVPRWLIRSSVQCGAKWKQPKLQTKQALYMFL